VFTSGSVTLYRNSWTFKMFDMLMRLPPVYMMDTLLVYNMGVNTDTSIQTVSPINEDVNITEEINNSTDLYQTFSNLYGGSPALLVIPHILRFIGCTIFYFLSMFVFFLPTESLIVFYQYSLALAVMPVSYISHKLMIDSCQEGNILSSYFDSNWSASLLSLNVNYRYISAVIINYILQTSLANIMQKLVKLSGTFTLSLREYLTVVMVSPCIFSLLSLPSSLLFVSAFVSNILPAILLGISLGQQLNKVIFNLKVMYRTKRDFITNFGLNTFIESEWVRLRVPSVLRYFWLSRMSLMLVIKQPTVSLDTSNMVAAFECTKQLVIQGSDTIVTVLGMTSVVSTLSHWLGLMFQILLAADHEEDKSVASVSAVLFFVLALQTGLTGMNSEKRFHQICKNLCLLLTAILHFVHSMVQPVLMSISASRNNNRSSHIRALSICLFLLMSPTLLVLVLWQYFNVGTWLLAVTAFCIEVVVKVLVTVLVYGLFMWDSHCQDGLWESLDDWVYYIRAVGNVVEFCFAVFLFFNGGWILLFESGGTIRACMMLIHAYFNIWCEARNGWSAFTKRRTAVAKINSLTDATEEDINKHNDVCAICYQEMTVAKITRCRHMFHSICLRKWLYMQDNCPMCHEKLYKSDATSQTDAEPPVVANEDNNNEADGDQNEDASDNYTDMTESDPDE